MLWFQGLLVVLLIDFRDFVFCLLKVSESVLSRQNFPTS